jgi:hypothetical protein
MVQMRHYDVSRWADFAMNLLPAEEHSAMEQHLASGCTECAALCEFVRKVAGKVAMERVYDAITPELAVSARGVFRKDLAARQDTRTLWQGLRNLIATLTYDSALDLHPQGARAGRAANRQMMYVAGDFCLDLRFDRERDSMRVTLVGQMANQSDPKFKMASVPVLLLSGKKVVTETASNEFGEFTLEYTPKRDLRLSVPVTDAGVRLEVPLSQVLEEHEN